MTKRKTTTTTKLAQTASQASVRLPFIEHLNELRRRLFYVAVSIVVWSAAAYAIEHSIVGWLLAPAEGQKFIYTSVGGGLNFLFQVCLYVGIAFSVPVIVYQSLRYVQPLIGRHSTRFILVASAISGVLGAVGMLFGYFLGLPSALHFLLNQFHTNDISALITIQSYLSFVIIYLLGSSLMFQVPLIIFLINRIKPLRPKTLFKYERWVIVISLITAALINPSPHPYDLGIIAVPMILSYQIGILLVWLVNKRGRPAKLQQLRARDAQLQAERFERLKTVEYVWEQADLAMSIAPIPDLTPPVRITATSRPVDRRNQRRTTSEPPIIRRVPVARQTVEVHRTNGSLSQ
jgi:sec-independent protein translocase protein TatC